MSKVGEKSVHSLTFSIAEELGALYSAGVPMSLQASIIICTSLTAESVYTDDVSCTTLTVGETEIVETEISLIDDVTAGTVEAGKAVVPSANLDIGTFRNFGCVVASVGYPGVAGTLEVYPGTVSKGKLQLTVANQAGDTTVSLVVGAMGAARTINLPDPGKTAYLMMSTAQITTSEADVLDGVTAGTAAASKAVVLDSSGDVTLVDGGDIALGTSTGTKIGTATNQKLGFYNATPVVQQRTISYGHTWDITGASTVHMSNLVSILNEYYNILATIMDALDALGLSVKVDHEAW